jgi:hypothetical protein
MLPLPEAVPTPLKALLSAPKKLCVLGMMRTAARSSSTPSLRCSKPKPSTVVDSSCYSVLSIATAMMLWPALTAT